MVIHFSDFPRAGVPEAPRHHVTTYWVMLDTMKPLLVSVTNPIHWPSLNSKLIVIYGYTRVVNVNWTLYVVVLVFSDFVEREWVVDILTAIRQCRVVIPKYTVLVHIVKEDFEKFFIFGVGPSR